MANKKTWKTDVDREAGMEITSESATMIGSKENFVACTPEGTYSVGKQSFVCAPSDIRIAGLWTFNDAMVTGIPSTIVTPIPTVKYSLPTTGAANIAETVALLSKILV